ncbi:MAG: T9SS type A sorting domain-containing protein [Bacteroidia bacterium]|nr:T9SS type A sorting domain-containing protein [Bacteroidia bacterium]
MKFKTFTISSVLILCFLSLTHICNAQFSGCYDGSNWTANTTNTNGTVFIQTGGMSLLADTDGTGNGAGTVLDCSTGGQGNVSSCIVIPFSGQLIFDWSWSGGNLSTFLTEPFGYCINGNATTLTSVNPPPWGTGAGTDTVVVMAGDTFCFVVSSLFADSHPTLPTSCGVTNFSGPCSAPPPCNAGFSYISSSAWDSIIFMDTSSGNVTQWYWDFGDGDTSTLANPTHKYSSQGTYNVCLIVTSATGCMDTICYSIAVFPTGIDNVNSTPIICTINPNPSNGQIQLQLENISKGEPYSVLVFDMNGRKILTQEYIYTKKSQALDFTELTIGNYIIHVQINDQTITKQIIIQ